MPRSKETMERLKQEKAAKRKEAFQAVKAAKAQGATSPKPVAKPTEKPNTPVSEEAQGAVKETPVPQNPESPAPKPENKAPLKAGEAEKISRAQNGSDYLPIPKERGLFHVELDKPLFDPRTGVKKSKAYTQKFSVPEWNHFVKHSAGLGYKTVILWNPTLYVG